MRFCVSGGLFLRRPAQRAAEQRPDEERVGSDPRLGFAAFFLPPRSSLCGLFGAKNWVLQPENRPGRKRGPRETRASRTGLDNGPPEKSRAWRARQPKNSRKTAGCTLGYITAGFNLAGSLSYSGKRLLRMVNSAVALRK
jgi:hypothetical protein